MTATTQIDAFEATTQKTYQWLHDLDEEMGTGNRRRAYEIFRAYLHALRDRLPIEEVAQLAAQLPMLVRGFYYEGWDPTNKPAKMRREEFLEYVAAEGLLNGPDEAERMVQAATVVLQRRVSAGEVNQVLNALPLELRRLLKGEA